MSQVSVYIIAFNEADKVRATIESVRWADEIVLIDSWSTDGTADIATALEAMDLLPEPGDKKAIAAAAKSSNMLARVGAALTPGIQPSLLRMLLDDEFKGLRQIAVHRLREMEAT